MISFYVHIDDLTPSEPAQLPKTNHFNDPDEEILSEKNFNCYEAFLEDIRQNGLRFCLVVDLEGNILDGNCRYWCLKRLGYTFIPVNIVPLIGKELEGIARKLQTFYPKNKVHEGSHHRIEPTKSKD